jgi:CDP-diacylglycerol---serine O-phosphatidyltransferase
VDALDLGEAGAFVRKLNLRKSLFILPNLFTLASVFSGYWAILLCLDEPTEEAFYRAALLIVLAMLFDTIDGRVARLTRTQSAIGVQLDSLADVMSFGMAPAVLVYRWSLEALGGVGMGVAFFYLACGTIRLARFNVITTEATGAPKKPDKYILGLPIPAAAGILISIVVASIVTGSFEGKPVIIAALVVSLGIFMVSTIRFRSFKDLKLNWRTGILVLVAVSSTAFVAIHFQHASVALVWLLLCYVAIGLGETIFGVAIRAKNRRRRGQDSAV